MLVKISIHRVFQGNVTVECVDSENITKTCVTAVRPNMTASICVVNFFVCHRRLLLGNFVREHMNGNCQTIKKHVTLLQLRRICRECIE